jgi:hypothetical protein
MSLSTIPISNPQSKFDYQRFNDRMTLFNDTDDKFNTPPYHQIAGSGKGIRANRFVTIKTSLLNRCKIGAQKDSIPSSLMKRRCAIVPNIFVKPSAAISSVPTCDNTTFLSRTPFRI